MWRESDTGEYPAEADKPAWRASVVSTLTGKRRGFANLDDLFDFLRRHDSTELNGHLNHDQGEEGRGTPATTAT